MASSFIHHPGGAIYGAQGAAYGVVRPSDAPRGRAPPRAGPELVENGTGGQGIGRLTEAGHDEVCGLDLGSDRR
jgi:hypothetical protein